MKRPRIDREKLRDAIRSLGKEYVFYMLDDAIDMLPSSQLESLAGKYMDPKPFLAIEDLPKAKGLLAEIKAFQKSSLARVYYESFEVNWRNSSELSMGTIAWIARFRRLIRRCAEKAKKGDPEVVRKCMDILFGLLDTMDKGELEMVFFADDGGSWQVGVDWGEILPVWFKVLSATAEPDAYSHGVLESISRHQDYRRVELIGIALSVATPAQREILAALAEVKPTKVG
jgi:hypothetical protein